MWVDEENSYKQERREPEVHRKIGKRKSLVYICRGLFWEWNEDVDANIKRLTENVVLFFGWCYLLLLLSFLFLRWDIFWKYFYFFMFCSPTWKKRKINRKVSRSVEWRRKNNKKCKNLCDTDGWWEDREVGGMRSLLVFVILLIREYFYSNFVLFIGMSLISGL